MSSELLENLGAVRHALSSGDRENAIDLLVHLRDLSGHPDVFDDYIDQVKVGKLQTVSAWIERCMTRSLSGVSDVFGDDFEDIELDLEAAPSDWDLASVDHTGLKTPLESDGLGSSSLSGKFSLPSPTDIKAKKNRLLEKLSRLKEESESEIDPNKQTRPSLEAQYVDQTMDGIPKPQAADSDPFASLASDLESEPSEMDFDLGFSNPANNVQPSTTKKASVVEEDSSDAFDFDLGFENPATRSSRDNVRETKPNLAGTTKPKVDSRDRDYTPLAQVPAVANDIDDEFFALAESLASEAHDGSYRGEPVVPNETNRTANRNHGKFTHEEITDLHELSSAESLVLEDEVARPATNLSAILLEARRLYEAGEFSAALDITKKVLSRGEDQEAEDLRKTIEGELERKHLSTIGALSKTPQIGVSPSEIPKLDIDHRAGFLLSQIDGFMTFEDLVELSGMSRLETLQVLAELIDSKIIVNA